MNQKICWYIANYCDTIKYPFGGNKVEHRLLSSLPEKGYRIKKVTFDRAPHYIFSNLLFSNIWVLKKFLKEFDRNALCLVSQSSYARTIFLHIGLKFYKKYRQITFEHHLKYHDSGPLIKKIIWYHMEKTILKYFAKAIITVSRSSAQEIVNMGIKRDKINIISPSFFSPLLREDVPKIHSNEKDLTNILFVGCCSPRKGLIYLVRAMIYLKNYNIMLNIVGNNMHEVRYVRKLSSIIKKYKLEDKVLFHNFVSRAKLDEFFRSADIFVLPSLWEGFGMVLLEAMSYRLPIVATNAGAIPELVKDGKNGILVPPKDSKALSKALEILIKNISLRERFGKNGFEIAKSWPSWAEIGERFHSFVKRIDTKNAIFTERANSNITEHNSDYKSVNLACNLCGANHTKLLGIRNRENYGSEKYLNRRARIVKCKRCGLIYANPMPIPTKKQFRNDYSKRNFVTLSLRSRAKKEIEARLDRIVSWMGESGNLLDIGSGNGAFLALSMQRGFKAVGIETSRTYVKHSRINCPDIQVITKPLRDTKFPDNSFDIIHMNHVLEHVYDPMSELKEIRRILRPGGGLWIGVPNAEALVYAVTNIYFRLQGKRWVSNSMKPTGHEPHIYGFSIKTVKSYLNKVGFNVVFMNTITTRNDFPSDNSLKKRFLKSFYGGVLKFGQLMNKGLNIEVWAVKSL